MSVIRVSQKWRIDNSCTHLSWLTDPYLGGHRAMSDKHITDFVPFATHYWVSTLVTFVFNGLYSIFVLVSLSFETGATWHWSTLGVHFTTLYKVFTLQKRLTVHLQTNDNWSKRLPWFGLVLKLTQTPFVLTSFYTNCLFEVTCFNTCQAWSHFHAVAVAQFDCSFPTSAISGLSLRKLDIDWWLTLLPLFNGVSLIKLDLWSFHNLFFTTQSLAS